MAPVETEYYDLVCSYRLLPDCVDLPSARRHSRRYRSRAQKSLSQTGYEGQLLPFRPYRFSYTLPSIILTKIRPRTLKKHSKKSGQLHNPPFKRLDLSAYYSKAYQILTDSVSTLQDW